MPLAVVTPAPETIEDRAAPVEIDWTPAPMPAPIAEPPVSKGRTGPSLGAQIAERARDFGTAVAPLGDRPVKHLLDSVQSVVTFNSAGLG